MAAPERKRKPKVFIVMGQRFGMLTVTDTEKVSKQKKYLCRCDCGTIVSKTAGHLTAEARNGANSNCGCVGSKIDLNGWVAKRRPARNRTGCGFWKKPRAVA